MAIECHNNYLLLGYVDTVINSLYWNDRCLFDLGEIIIGPLILDGPLEGTRLPLVWLLHLMNSHIWQSLSLRDWRWKAAITLGWMGATFSGSSSWPPRSTTSTSLCREFSSGRWEHMSNSPRMGARRIWCLTQNFSCVFSIYPNSNPSYWKLVQKEDNCTINQLLRIFNYKDIIKNVSFFLLKLLFCPVILRNIRCSKQQISYKYWEMDFTLPHI